MIARRQWPKGSALFSMRSSDIAQVASRATSEFTTTTTTTRSSKKKLSRGTRNAVWIWEGMRTDRLPFCWPRGEGARWDASVVCCFLRKEQRKEKFREQERKEKKIL